MILRIRRWFLVFSRSSERAARRPDSIVLLYRWRGVFVAGVLAILLGGQIGRLAYLQILRHGYYSAVAADQQLGTFQLEGRRGTLSDRDGRPIAMTVQAADVFVSGRVGSDESIVSDGSPVIAAELEMDPGEVADVWRRAEGDVLVGTLLDPEKALALMEEGIPGVRVSLRWARMHPQGDEFAHLLGEVDAEQTGVSGIEAALDPVLRGTHESVTYERDGLGNPLPFGKWGDVIGTPGSDVSLTVDEQLQKEISAVLADSAAASPNARIDGVVMDVATGEILAMAESSSGGSSYAGPAAALSSDAPAGGLLAALLLPAALSPDLCQESAACAGFVASSDILGEGLPASAVRLATLLGPANLNLALKRFGLGESTGIDIPGEIGGSLPLLSGLGTGLSMDTLPSQVRITTLQVAAAAAVTANGGTWRTPRFIAEGNLQSVARPVVSTLAAARSLALWPPRDAARNSQRVPAAVVSAAASDSSGLAGWSVGFVSNAAGRTAVIVVRARFAETVATWDPAADVLRGFDGIAGAVANHSY